MLGKLLHTTITTKEKAAIAFIVSTVGSYLTTNGLTWSDLLHWATLWSVVVGIATHQAVYWVTNQIEK